ncbi:uncharacterized protein LOC142983050 [Anticarsia gemmatalis]|uniref:uncharacterized protein LOC142983050 n=1 Tax=Anticarsia gemmatalis TaxID=129554 RepID=UPI003F76B09F
MVYKSLCALSVAPHLRVMRRVGFCRLSARSGAGRLRRAAHRLYHVFALSATSVYVLQQLIYAVQERKDLAKLTQVMFVMLCFGTCVGKQLAFYLDADDVDALISALDEPLLNQAAGAGGAGEALLRGTVRGAARLLRVYSGCAVSTCVLWTVFPVLYRIQGLHFEFPFWTGICYDHIVV